MKIKAPLIVNIPDVLEPRLCRRLDVKPNEIECCQFISYSNMECILFNESIYGFQKCESCKTAIKKSEEA